MNSLNRFSPQKDLELSIISRIKKEERKSSIVHSWTTGTIAIMSCISLVPSFIYLGKSVQTSGFYDFVSLSFSEGISLLSYWKEFSLSLAESLPFLGLIVLLALLAIFVWSLSKTTYSIRKIVTI